MAVDQIPVFDNQQRAPIQIEYLDDPLLRVSEARVRLIGWHIDEGGREIGEELLEPSQPLLGRPFRCQLETPPLCRVDRRSSHDTLLHCDEVCAVLIGVDGTIGVRRHRRPLPLGEGRWDQKARTA